MVIGSHWQHIRTVLRPTGGVYLGFPWLVPGRVVTREAISHTVLPHSCRSLIRAKVEGLEGYMDLLTPPTPQYLWQPRYLLVPVSLAERGKQGVAGTKGVKLGIGRLLSFPLFSNPTRQKPGSRWATRIDLGSLDCIQMVLSAPRTSTQVRLTSAGRWVTNAPPLAPRTGNSRTQTLVYISDLVNDRYRHRRSRCVGYTAQDLHSLAVCEGGNRNSLACSFGRWRGQRVASREGDNVPCGLPCSRTFEPRTFLLESSLPLSLFRVGGSGGDDVTHVMIHHLRERAGAGDTVQACAAPGLH
ncbi:hypothetical protein EDB83DRAFT_2552585 [Lactarius deliciosus]|nr:hypothetical protein EDB83DRAFT_2552585 [Lactarius deliciosus]